MSRIVLPAVIILFFPLAALAAGGGGGGGGGGGAGGGGGGGGHGGSVAGATTGRAGKLNTAQFGLQFNTTGNHLGEFVPFNYHASPGYPVAGVWGGFGGELPPALYYYYYGYPTPPSSAGSPTMSSRLPSPRPRARPQPTGETSNEYAATLHLALPVSGEVWVNGEKSTTKPSGEWTLESPLIKSGEQYTFDVKARWVTDGTTYEFTRTIDVGSGQRGRISVLSGTPVESSASR